MKDKTEYNDVIGINETAEILGISNASVRNWVLHNFLFPVENKTKLIFTRNDVIHLKNQIENGKLNRLQQRANKRNANRIFLPKEYLNNKTKEDFLIRIQSYIKENNLTLNDALYFLIINYLKSKDLLNYKDKSNNIRVIDTFNKSIRKELREWYSERNQNSYDAKYFGLLEFYIPDAYDVLGTIYQSLSKEGKKAKEGSYYTPDYLVKKIIGDYYKPGTKYLDPCCGTGQFLLQYADISNDPLAVTGFDIDNTAVKIARINLVTKFRHFNFNPKIFCNNTLYYEKESNDFDFIATNPPWGLHFTREELGYLYRNFSGIKSFESFSYFLITGLKLLKPNGIMSFILPEAILNVRMHSDIREYILKNSSILKVELLGHVFKNVFSNVIRIDLEKRINEIHSIKITKGSSSHFVEQKKFEKNRYFSFEIFINENDNSIMENIYRKEHITLENRSEWALGIVTGDNEKYISEEFREGFEELYKGRDVNFFTFNKPSSFIKFEPEKFQQAAPENLYRVDEKLIYRFISKYLVFAYDNQQRLTLNSANILIPKIQDYPMKLIAALFNSTLYQFIFQKKFNSIKILRSHLEELPLPVMNSSVQKDILDLVSMITMGDNKVFQFLDQYIMCLFNLSEKEIAYILNFVQGSRNFHPRVIGNKSYNLLAGKSMILSGIKSPLKKQ